MAITGIKLKNGNGDLKINTHLTLGALREAQIKGFLSKDFITGAIKTIAGSSTDEPKPEDLPMNDLLLMDLAYVCYRTGNKNPMNIDDFLDSINLDFEVLVNIYLEVITNLMTKPGNMPNDFKNATPRNNSNGKKKKHRR